MFIADVGANHNASLVRAFRIIEVAQSIGCWGVKFQLYKVDKLYAKASKLGKTIPKELELPVDWLPKLKTKCDKVGIRFGCTPFYDEAVEELAPYVDFLKISSFDILRTSMIDMAHKVCVDKEIPLFVSTGLATFEQARGLKEIYGAKLLHCVSKYPVHYQRANLSMIESPYIDGYSDHTANAGVVYKAWALGAKYIEFHMDLDSDGWEYRQGHCWLPEKMYGVIKNIEEGETAFAISGFDEADYLQKADPSDGLRPMKIAR